MRLRTAILTAALTSLPTAALAQDQDMQAIIGNFAGMADQVRSANPVLSVTQGGSASGGSTAGLGAGGLSLSSLLGTKKPKFTGYGTGQGLRLSVQQQEALKRRQQELDAAKRRPARAAAKKTDAPTAASGSAQEGPARPGDPLRTGPPAGLLDAATKKLEVRLVNDGALQLLAKGQDRESILARLGAPSFTSAVSGLEEGYRETLAYHLDPENIVTVRLLDGKLQEIIR